MQVVLNGVSVGGGFKWCGMKWYSGENLSGVCDSWKRIQVVLKDCQSKIQVMLN